MDYDRHTALLVVDVQNDFADTGGSLYVTGGEQIVGFVNEQVAAAVDAGATVVYTMDWHPESTPHFAKDGGIWPVHCVHGTWGAELHPDLVVADGAEVQKTGVGGEDGYSGFNVRDPVTGETSPTGLADTLRSRSAERVVVVGLAADYCVKETAIDGATEGFEVTLLADGTRAVDLAAGDGYRAVAAMVAAGVAVR
jgi:nicotinamidase/pyrazinamidase